MAISLIKPTPFLYLNYKFTPAGTIKGIEIIHDKIRPLIVPIDKYSSEKFTHEAFYKVASQHGCGNVDIFKMQTGMLVIAIENTLMQWLKN